MLTTLKGRSAASAERVRLAGIEVVDDDDAIALEICERGTAVPQNRLPAGFSVSSRAGKARIRSITAERSGSDAAREEKLRQMTAAEHERRR